MNENTSQAGKNGLPIWKRIFRFSLKSMLLLATVFGVIAAIESNRINAQNHIASLNNREATGKQIFPFIEFESDVRFSWLEVGSAVWLKSYLGPQWNRDINSMSVVRKQPDTRLMRQIGLLKRLRILDFRAEELTEDDMERFVKMKNLQWLNLSGTSCSREAIQKLRQQLPNTFVTFAE